LLLLLSLLLLLLVITLVLGSIRPSAKLLQRPD
jgi:hypothetical protein